MKIQRHVRQDFQPVYIKLETLDEAKALSELITWDGNAEWTPGAKEIWDKLTNELDSIIAAKGVLP